MFPGKFIPASQRPDGTWRKARRVKDGYVPQEEVPLYESKGKQFTKKPDIPVGMCPLMAKAAKEKREKQEKKLLQKQIQQQQQQTSQTNGGQVTKKPSKATTSVPKKSPAAAPAHTSPAVQSVTDALATLDLNNVEDVQRQLKKLRKKIREIEAIEEKLNSGDLKQPEQDQLEKVRRKPEILGQIAKLEAL